jgi:hypothetical protein
MVCMDILRLASKSRVSVPVLTVLLNAERFRYVWVVEGGSVEFSDLMTESEWTHRVVKEFRVSNNVLVLRKRLGPYVEAEGRKGHWILVADRNVLERGSAIEKAVVNAANSAMENGYEEVFENEDVESVAIDMMSNDADVEKLTAYDDSPFKQADVVFAINQWRQAHTWEDFTKVPA